MIGFIDLVKVFCVNNSSTVDINQFISFILFVVQAIKDMVSVLSGRKSVEEVQGETDEEETE